ncbi:D-alanyl-D-alanine carboxypeptidase family protein [Alkalicoccus luteus]|nr:D-alanyl-D-alanine carboxypeptidase family protein [Alkalicoccus luteus]
MKRQTWKMPGAVIAAASLLLIGGGQVSAYGEAPRIESESAFLMDAGTGEVLYEKNASERMYPASITKIVSGLLAVEEADLSETAVVSENAVETDGTSVFLLEDEEMELRQLVEGLVINSGNDAGTVIAEHLAGSEEAFAEKMTDFVREKAGAVNTQFQNPHGLYHPDHYTTAEDMAAIAQYAMKNDEFMEIAGTRELDWEGEGWETTIYNHHLLLGNYAGVTGLKNGFVSQSGFTLVTTAERDGTSLIAVTLKAPTSDIMYQDTEALLDYGFHQSKKRGIGLLPRASAAELNQQKLPLTIAVDVSGYGSVRLKKWNGDILLEEMLQDPPEQLQ